MYGAILGDIIGQPYEFDRSPKTKDFPLFSRLPHFTDDSVMTIAICDGILKAGLDADENTMKTAMITSMQLWGHKYPHAGYGG
ncbi:MAG: ADP-ribosylglycohydrolase family protein, partial [Treponema sp.]|nr:ADP-ribosylglycohydrolase family protein [Treponema sp.]